MIDRSCRGCVFIRAYPRQSVKKQNREGIDGEKREASRKKMGIFAHCMGRILSVDYGKKRTGLAVTDPAQIIPGGLTTVETHKLFDFLKDYLGKEDVETLVIGWPVQTNGLPSENQARVEAFITRFQKLYPTVPVIKYDERYTSTLAHRVMIDAGLGKKRRQDKALVDEISATLILQSYMESRMRF